MKYDDPPAEGGDKPAEEGDKGGEVAASLLK